MGFRPFHLGELPDGNHSVNVAGQFPVFNSPTSCGVASFMPAALTRMNGPDSLQVLPPRIGMAVQVHHRNDQNLALLNRID